VSLSISEFNALPAAEAAALLRSTCGASRWVDAMVARRPFSSVDALLSAADEVWTSTGPDDWREAFSHHPRIGERARATASAHDARGAAWSSAEQSRVEVAPASVRDQLAAVNQEYEQRFGHSFIICATEKSAEEMLSTARQRLENDPVTELRTAAEEQRKITQLRLLKLFGEGT